MLLGAGVPAQAPRQQLLSVLLVRRHGEAPPQQQQQQDEQDAGAASPRASSGRDGSPRRAVKRRRVAGAGGRQLGEAREQPLGLLPLPADWALRPSPPPTLAELRARIAACLQVRALRVSGCSEAHGGASICHGVSPQRVVPWCLGGGGGQRGGSGTLCGRRAAQPDGRSVGGGQERRRGDRRRSGRGSKRRWPWSGAAAVPHRAEGASRRRCSAGRGCSVATGGR